jgi:hypothetical protein
MGEYRPIVLEDDGTLRQLPIGSTVNQPVYTWEVANRPDRLSLSVGSEDIGKIAWQINDNSFWILTSTLPEWSSLSGGNTTVGSGGLIDGGLRIETSSIIDGGNRV